MFGHRRCSFVTRALCFSSVFLSSTFRVRPCSSVAMEPKLSRHYARLRHLRESFAEENERLVACLRNAQHAAERAPAGGWSAVQIGWHVATVTTRFPGLITGDLPGVERLPDDFREREWQAIAEGIPAKFRTPAGFEPPRSVS
jgi:hypothetical protein